MAKFYSEIDSVRGSSVHRLGHHSTSARVCSWHGGIETTLYESDSGDVRAKIEARPWKGRGKWVLLYDGPLSECFDASPAKPLCLRGEADVA